MSSDNDVLPSSDGRISRATAHRLSLYLRCIAVPAREGGTVSSLDLARAIGVSAAQVRRDLAALGHLGRRGVGYDARSLTNAIRHTLGIDRRWRGAIVGVGNLARALLGYRGFRDQGFEIVGLFDADPHKVGQSLDGLTIEPVSAIAARVPVLSADLGILTVPAAAAQPAADALVAAGVRGLLNFAPAILTLPAGVQVVSVDLSIQLEQLAFLVHDHSA